MNHSNTKVEYIEMLNRHRLALSRLDNVIIELLAQRMAVAIDIGKLKHKNKVGIEQKDFWQVSSEVRAQHADSNNLDLSFVEELFACIHKESIKIQHLVFEELDNASK